MSEKNVLNNQLAGHNPLQAEVSRQAVPADYSTGSGVDGVMENLNPEPGGWWQKATGFLGTPLGRALGTGLLTGGVVAASGGDGLEALSYGAQSAGRASDIYRRELARQARRDLEEQYFQSKLRQQQAEQENRQQERAEKARRDKELEDYRYQNEIDKLLLQSQLGKEAQENEPDMVRDKPLNLTDTLALAGLRADYSEMPQQQRLMNPGEKVPAAVSVPYEPVSPGGAGKAVLPQMTSIPKFVF